MLDILEWKNIPQGMGCSEKPFLGTFSKYSSVLPVYRAVASKLSSQLLELKLQLII